MPDWFHGPQETPLWEINHVHVEIFLQYLVPVVFIEDNFDLPLAMLMPDQLIIDKGDAPLCRRHGADQATGKMGR